MPKGKDNLSKTHLGFRLLLHFVNSPGSSLALNCEIFADIILIDFLYSTAIMVIDMDKCDLETAITRQYSSILEQMHFENQFLR